MPDSSASPPSDEALVRAARAGDSAALGTLTERHFASVFGVAYGVLQDREAAEEVAQETFLRACLQLESLRDDAKFGGWVCMIARNIARSWRGKELRRSGLLMRVPIDEHVANVADESTPRADELLAASEQQRDVMAALEQLPPTERQAVLMHYIEGMPAREIGRHLEVPHSTVTRRLARAIERLRAVLVHPPVPPPRPAARRKAVGIVLAAAALPSAARAEIVRQTSPLPGLASNLASGVMIMGSNKLAVALVVALALAGGIVAVKVAVLFDGAATGSAQHESASGAARTDTSYQLGTAREMRLRYGDTVTIPLAANPYKLKTMRFTALENHTVAIHQEYDDGRVLDGVLGRAEDGAPSGIAPDLMVDFKMPEQGQNAPAALVMGLVVPGSNDVGLVLESRVSPTYAAPLLTLKNAYQGGKLQKAEYVKRRAALRQQTGMEPTNAELRRRLDEFDAQMPM